MILKNSPDSVSLISSEAPLDLRLSFGFVYFAVHKMLIAHDNKVVTILDFLNFDTILL